MKEIKKVVKDYISVDNENGFLITGCDNLEILKLLPDNCIDNIYIDPPYFTNKAWEKNGWKFEDNFDSMWDYLFFMGERLTEAKRIMRTSTFTLKNDVLYRDDKIETHEPLINKIKEDYSSASKKKLLEKGVEIGASIFVHIDYRTNNEIKTYLMDPLFGEGKGALEWDEIQDLFEKKLNKRCHTPISVPEVNITSGPSICLDFFGGSHSYAIAAYKLGRRFISIEMNKSEQLFISGITDKKFGCERED